MKKLICFALALTMVFAIGVTAFAENSTGGTTTLTTTIPVTYTVTIPASTGIAFNAETTSIGEIAVTAARIEAGKKITVAATGDSTLSCGEADIAYALMVGGETFTSAEFTELTSVALDVAIEQSAWNGAPAAGTYRDIITFEVSYA